MMSVWRALRGWIFLFGAVAAGWALLHYVVLAPQPVEVRAHRVGRGVVERTVANTKAGSVRSRMDAQITADASGIVLELFHREGARVEVGEPLVRLDDRRARAAVEVARRDMAALEALERQAQASADEAVREFGRLEALREREAVSQAELDRADSQAKITGAALEAAQARVVQARALVAQAELELAKMTVRAPFAGVIAARYVEVGEWAGPGKALLRLVDPDRIYIRAGLDEVDIAEIRPELPARVTMDPYKNRTWDGRIVRVAPHVSEVLEQSRTVEIEVEIQGIDGETLKPGTSADVVVVLERTGPDVLRVPTLAVIEGKKVLVARDGFAREVEIEPGLRNWDYTEIRSGLSEGELVVLSLDKQEVRDGARIRIKEIDEK